MEKDGMEKDVFDVSTGSGTRVVRVLSSPRESGAVRVCLFYDGDDEVSALAGVSAGGCCEWDVVTEMVATGWVPRARLGEFKDWGLVVNVYDPPLVPGWVGPYPSVWPATVRAPLYFADLVSLEHRPIAGVVVDGVVRVEADHSVYRVVVPSAVSLGELMARGVGACSVDGW